jgi:hypothetical protein
LAGGGTAIRKKIQSFTWIVQIAALPLMVVLLSARVKAAADYLQEYRGLLQRLVYTVYCLWLVPVGVKLYRQTGAGKGGD